MATADDKQLRTGKPAPDPFLLAADCLGYEQKKMRSIRRFLKWYSFRYRDWCATVIAVCTQVAGRVWSLQDWKIAVPIMSSKIWIMLSCEVEGNTFEILSILQASKNTSKIIHFYLRYK